VRDNLNFVRGSTSWTAPTLLNSWVNYDATTNVVAGYRLVGDFVYIQGMVKSGTLSSVVFTLPAGYRPLRVHRFAQDNNAAYGAISIDASGNVTQVAGASTAVLSLDCCFSIV
jgi:hypothetical protein